MSSRRFLDRWSRLKHATEKAQQIGEVPPASGAAAQRAAEEMLVDLGPDSDFRAFLNEEVSEAVRRQAMKTLFADPRFNVIDPLDIYIDDYSISDPIPAEMLATLNQAKFLWEEKTASDDSDVAAQDCTDVERSSECGGSEPSEAARFTAVVTTDSPGEKS